MKVSGPLFLHEPSYYAHPEGTAPIEKIVSLGKKGLLASLGVGIMDCVFITDTKNALETLNCMAYWIVPTLGLTTMWASTTYMSTRIRGKDDTVNYLVGVASCAPILHAWKKSLPFTLYMTGACMFLAAIAKDKRNVGWKLFLDDAPHEYGIHWADMSLTKPLDKDFRTPYRNHW